MLVIPAIDIKDGRCVRLYQGDMAHETVYFDRPQDAARHLAAHGARLIHVVDLNGAVTGRPVHVAELEAICRESGVPVEVGGGLRTMAAIEQAFAAGVERVVLGTRAHESQEFLSEACVRFPDRIVVGIDARNGQVAVKGWVEDTGRDAVELAQACERAGASRIIYTDIGRDGTSAGVNIEPTRLIARTVGIPVIASGGVGCLDDIRRLRSLESEGVEAVIVGRALYNGAFSLEEACAAAGGCDAE